MAQVISEETRPILEKADRMNDEAVRVWARREEVMESLSSRWVLRRSSSGRATLGLVKDRE